MNTQLLSPMTNLSTETDSSVDTQLRVRKDRYGVILRLPHAKSVIITLVYTVTGPILLDDLICINTHKEVIHRLRW